MKVKRFLILGFVLILMTGTLSTQAATTQNSFALEPWTLEIVDQADNVLLGAGVSIDHYKRDGRAYISYYDYTHGNLKMAFEVTPGTGNCYNADWECQTIDDSGDVGQYSSIDVFEAILIKSNGVIFNYAKIGISYYNASWGDLKYAQRSCSETAFGIINCGWTVTTVDDEEERSNGSYTSFQFSSSGTPIIYYHGQDFFNLGYVKRARLEGSVTGSCGNGWACDKIAQSSADATYGSHISADGNMVAYYDGANGQLMLATPSGTTYGSGCGLVNYWNCVVIDSGGFMSDVGKFVSLLSGDATHPTQMAYYDAHSAIVKYAYATAGTGNCTNQNYICFTVDIANDDDFIGISMALDLEGSPIIVYQSKYDSQAPPALKIARPATAYGNLAGNCGEVPPGLTTQYWQCEFLDADPDSYLAAYVDVSVSPAGLESVAYSDYTLLADFTELGRLKVAQQHFPVYLPLINR